MRRIVLWTLMLLGLPAAAAVSPASAQDKLSVRLDFSPWGVQAAMHLAQNQGLVQGSRSRRRHSGRPRLRQYHPTRQCRPGRCRPGAGRAGRLGARQGRHHPLDRDISAPHRSLHPRRQGVADEQGRRSPRQDRGGVRGKPVGALHRHLSESGRAQPRRPQGRCRRSRGAVGHLYRQASGRVDVDGWLRAADRRCLAALEMPAGLAMPASPFRATAWWRGKTPSRPRARPCIG